MTNESLKLRIYCPMHLSTEYKGFKVFIKTKYNIPYSLTPIRTSVYNEYNNEYKKRS